MGAASWQVAGATSRGGVRDAANLAPLTLAPPPPEVLARLGGTSTLPARRKETLRLALQASTVKRALKYAVVGGLILITINHGDALLHAEVTRARLFKMALPALVPYVVSTLSSVGAIRERSEGPDRKPRPE